MELKQLDAFVRVAESGSFSRAALSMGMAQPLLSRQVRQLEVGLRQTLLRRNGRGVTLTDSGKVLLEHARGILHQVALAHEELAGSRHALAGRVSIGLPPSLSRFITVPLTKRFRQMLPEAQLTLTEGFSLPMIESVRAGQLDMGVLYNPAPAPDLELSVLRQDTLSLISRTDDLAPAKTRVGPADLAKLPLILPSRPNAFRLLIESEMARLDLKPHIVLEIDGLNAILELVREGLGHAVLPTYTLGPTGQSQGLVSRRIDRPRLVGTLMLAHSAKRAVTPTHDAAQSILRSVLQESLKGQTLG
jgi:LysR family nitrogen assimilation transcriptional regulator